MIEYTTVRFKFEDERPTRTEYRIMILDKAIDHKYDDRNYLTYQSFKTIYDAITYLNTYKEKFLQRDLEKLDLDEIASIECVIEEYDINDDDNVIEVSYEETLWER